MLKQLFWFTTLKGFLLQASVFLLHLAKPAFLFRPMEPASISINNHSKSRTRVYFIKTLMQTDDTKDLSQGVGMRKWVQLVQGLGKLVLLDCRDYPVIVGLKVKLDYYCGTFSCRKKIYGEKEGWNNKISKGKINIYSEWGASHLQVGLHHIGLFQNTH